MQPIMRNLIKDARRYAVREGLIAALEKENSFLDTAKALMRLSGRSITVGSPKHEVEAMVIIGEWGWLIPKILGHKSAEMSIRDPR